MRSSPPRRPITVLQLIPALETGGAERTTVDIAAALAARSDRALVASLGGRLEAELATAGGELIRLAVGSKNPAAMAANALRIARLIGRERVDLVHARSRAPAWAAILACRRTRTPFVTTYHGVYGERSAPKRLYNSVMARGDLVIANSAYTARLIQARYGTPAERIAAIHRGADLRRFDAAAVDEPRRAALRSAWGFSGPERIVLNLARLAGWKGQRVLIEAAALPPLAGMAGLVVVLAGDEQGRGGYRRELEALIAARGLADRVRIVGHCDDVPAALSLAEAAVVASTEPEAFGRAAVEAEAMGVPVVATDLGAAAETVLAPPEVDAAARTGWRVPPGDAAALAAAIGGVLALAGPERAALAARARAHAERFSVEAMQAATLAAYDRLLSRAGNRTPLGGADGLPRVDSAAEFPDSPGLRWRLRPAPPIFISLQRSKENSPFAVPIVLPRPSRKGRGSTTRSAFRRFSLSTMTARTVVSSTSRRRAGSPRRPGSTWSRSRRIRARRS